MRLVVRFGPQFNLGVQVAARSAVRAAVVPFAVEQGPIDPRAHVYVAIVPFAATEPPAEQPRASISISIVS